MATSYASMSTLQALKMFTDMIITGADKVGAGCYYV
jgi:hypothetical protein